MKQQYVLKNAITFNPTGKLCNAVAAIATSAEIKAHKEYFGFNFQKNINDKATVYKITKQTDDDVIQGLVSVKPAEGFLDCGNMELHKINKKPLLLHNGVGKAMVALCCKISFELGNDGYITFDAKTNLVNYYTRLGALNIGGIRMYIPTTAAKKLVDIYF